MSITQTIPELIADLRARLAAAEKEREHRESLWKETAERLRECQAERDEARALAAKMEKGRDEARTEAECFRAGVLHPDPATNAEVEADRDAARAFDAAAGIRDEWHKGKPDWEHRAAEDKARAERAEALAAMRGEALRGLLSRPFAKPGWSDEWDRLMAAARAALYGDAGEWLAARDLRVATAVREACVAKAAQPNRYVTVSHGAYIEDEIRALDLSALLKKLP